MKAGYTVFNAYGSKLSMFIVVSNYTFFNNIRNDYYRYESIARKKIDNEIGMWHIKIKQS